MILVGQYDSACVQRIALSLHLLGASPGTGAEVVGDPVRIHVAHPHTPDDREDPLPAADLGDPGAGLLLRLPVLVDGLVVVAEEQRPVIDRLRPEGMGRVGAAEQDVERDLVGAGRLRLLVGDEPEGRCQREKRRVGSKRLSDVQSARAIVSDDHRVPGALRRASWRRRGRRPPPSAPGGPTRESRAGSARRFWR